MGQNADIQQVIQIVREKYAPDKRVEVFHITSSERNDTLILRGETTRKDAYEEILFRMKNVSGRVKDSIRLLPGKRPGEETQGVIYNSVGTIRSDHRYSAELVTQALLGTPVKILDKAGGWLRIQTPDRYIGWVNGSVKTMTETAVKGYLRQPKVIVTSMYAQSYEKPDVKSPSVSDLVAGNMLTMKGAKGKFYHVAYPDDREAYILKSDAERVENWLRKIDLSGEGIVRTANRFMGVPYLWGGTSPKGVDCSGFTKSVYFLHGILLARDASQQVLYGKLIDEEGYFGDARPGDLVFFGTEATPEQPGERVVHVGIYLGNKRFIHASDYIRIGSFDPVDPLYDAYNTNRYLRTKRILGEVGTPGIDAIFENEFYVQ